MNHAAPSLSTGSPDDAAVALRGASLAFQRSPAAGSASPTTISSSLELSHLREAGGSRTFNRSRSPHRKGASSSNASHGHHGHAYDADSSGYQASLVAARLHQLNGSSPLQPPTSAQRLDPKNPSFIAATLAASRSVSPSPLVQTPRRRISFGAANALAISVPGDAVDSESIPPTGNLISLFEPGREAGPPLRRRSPPRSSPPEAEGRLRGEKRVHEKKPSAVPPTSSPASSAVEVEGSHLLPSSGLPTPPLRSSEKISAMPMPKPKLPPQLSSLSLQHGHHNSPKVQTQAPPAGGKPRRSGPSASPARPEKPAAARPHRARPPSPPSVVRASTPEVLSPKPMRLVKKHSLAPPVLSSPPRNSSPDRSSQAASSPSPDPEKRSPRTNWRAPTPPKPRGSQRLVTSRPTSRSRHRGNSDDAPVMRSKPITASSRTEFGLPIVSRAPPPPPLAASRKTTPPPLPGRRGDSVASAPTSPMLGPRSSGRRRLTTTSTSSNLPLDTLTSAMMASSLASARLTPHSTGSSLPPPSLPKRQKSPRLLQTLRQPQSHEDEDPERLKIAHRHKLFSNKHAHHEGARKRWRDQLTQRERKRYEAVWASNRGHLLDGDDSPATDNPASGVSRINSECVANVVVREIWKRSRLPQDELMEVWELVDRGHVGKLTRQEFIVGLWLIDQRLRGRKLPARVSDSVWVSANGVRVLQPRRK
ncbi:hypothetical protein EsDP_00004329 [Epichloe bromicola]|uniref:EH domain-containing protein n=1 Tax=Epichloe bromicola TaxID=79588 RepID=A0ABQ0CRF2_9HYPO